MTGWKPMIQEALETNAIDSLIEKLSETKTKHAGTAPAKIKNQVIKVLQKKKSESTYLLICNLCHREDPTAQEIGAIAITEYYTSHSIEVNEILYRLADSAHWEVREWVASACGILLGRHFEQFLAILKEWVSDASENRRRAVVLASMYAGKERNPAYAEPLLNLLEPLLSDRSRYVRDNLGPFAIGSALIKYYPNHVMDKLNKWMMNDDEQTRWNVAMVFSSAVGASFADEAQPILDQLKEDSSPYVKKAVEKALKTISKKF